MRWRRDKSEMLAYAVGDIRWVKHFIWWPTTLPNSWPGYLRETRWLEWSPVGEQLMRLNPGDAHAKWIMFQWRLD